MVLYYYSLACLLMKKYSHSFELLTLVKTLYQINFSTSRSILMDYYKTKTENILALLQSLLQKGLS